MDPRLIITNIGYTLSALITLSLGVFVFAKNPRQPLSIIFFLLSIATLGFEVSHVFGINTVDPELARRIFMWNLVNIPIVALNYHWVLELIGSARRHLKSILVIYGVGVALLIFYVLRPDTFLLLPESKLGYLPNYYVPGEFYIVMRAYFVVVSLYFIYHIFRAYKTTNDPVFRNRLRYVLLGVAFAYATGSTAVFLVYGVEIDPIWSMFLGLYSVPFAYAILKYELMDIKVVAKRALSVATTVSFIGVAIGLVSFSNNWIIERMPSFPIWIIPFLSSALAFGVGFFVWQKIRETDLLKYEFITIVTHKFRTPLTHIKWAVENLLEGSLSDEKRKQASAIQSANFRLVELTNLLIGLTDSENSSHRYVMSRFYLGSIVAEVLSDYSSRFSERNLRLESNITDDLPAIFGDTERLKYAVQVLFDNALAYTPSGGIISVSLFKKGAEVVCEVKDNGIGIPKEEVSLVFSKFFRGQDGKSADTEGMGIGLFMAKTIISRHGGCINVASEGRGKGSTFSFALPLAR